LWPTSVLLAMLSTPSNMTSSLRQRFDDEYQQSISSHFSRRYSDSDSSDKSYHSGSTAPTDYGDVEINQFHGKSAERPLNVYQGIQHYLEEPVYNQEHGARTSVETYASTVPSVEDLQDAEVPPYETLAYRPAAFFSEASPVLSSTPADFAELFPSTRRLAIRHDDSTSDGNMNLRCTTNVTTVSGREQDMTLFHLRMYDLKKREFSLRRYDRDSGREVCHSVRRYQKSASEKRPSFQRSLSNAFATLKSKSDSRTPTLASLTRFDSGHSSIKSVHDQQRPDDRPQTAGDTVRTHALIPTNTTKLEFSNYAQVDVKRRGAHSNKRYEFEYWGSTFFWKRVVQKNGSSKAISFKLFRSNSDKPLAYIIPEVLKSSQQHEEAVKGGWVPPCAMRIIDEQLCQMQNDVSDVIIASGLIALVDDCIKRRFNPKPARHLLIPVPWFKMDMEYVGPKRLINEVFSRPSTRDSTNSRHSTPLRQRIHDRP